MVIKNVNDQNLNNVLEAGTYADCPAVTNPNYGTRGLSDEQRDLFGEGGFDSTLNVNLEPKDNILSGQQKKSEFEKEENKDDKQKALFRCQLAFMPATIQFDRQNFASSFVQNLLDGNQIAINSSNRAEANEILSEMDEYLAENPEAAARMENLYNVAARNENGQIFLTEEEKMEWEAENLNVCTINPTVEGMVDHVESGRDSMFAHLESTEPTKDARVTKAEFEFNGG
ncbi:MAG: hypothetical protein ACPG05_03800 [Bdellovibrionales bacterium]